MFINSDSPNLDGILLIDREIKIDQRGWFSEIFNFKKIQDECNLELRFIQDNISFSKKGVLRGLHYQFDNPQGKFLTVLQGEIFDVAVDLRRKSSTFGRWYGVELTESSNKSIWIPPGFAHGTLTLSETSLVSYKVTREWIPGDEYIIFWADPLLNIDWPIKNIKLTLNNKDVAGLLFEDAPKFNF